MAKQDAKPKDGQLEVMAEPSRVVPKLVTKVAVGKTSGNVIISFIFELPNEKPQLIERLVMDGKLADDLCELIQNVKEVGND